MRKFLDKLAWNFIPFVFLMLCGSLFSLILAAVYGEDFKPAWWVYVIFAAFCIVVWLIADWIYYNKIDKLNVKLKLINNDYTCMPEKKGDLIDLRAAQDIEMKQFQYGLIPLGVSMKLPAGYRANLVPRSSTWKNYGIIMSNSVGIIDSNFCGSGDEWKFPAIALRDTVIHKGDRICQFEIVPVMSPVRFDITVELEDKNRGGIGSTGAK